MNEQIKSQFRYAADLNLIVAAGHGLTVGNVGALAKIPQISEFNSRHGIISRAVFTKLPAAVKANARRRQDKLKFRRCFAN